ncbi:MAG TPA: Ku protein [Mycobacteriales bacterium]|nr:Ku protein [Mycobacteriales bacterium]
MRAIWKGAVSFGLVSIPVKLFSATEEHDIRFHQVHRADGGRIKYKRTCSVDGKEVSYDEIAKGYELDSGETVILTDEDFAQLPLKTTREIDVVEFVPDEQVDPVMYAKTYYLEPEGKATKPYVLLREALKSTDRVAIVKVALRQRESLAALRVRDDVIVLQMLLWPDEVRQPDFGFLDDDVAVRPQELQMASSLVESMAADFDPNEFHDDYREALQSLIDAKEGRAETVETPVAKTERTGQVVDLMSALRASVERARSGRAPAEDTAGEEPAPAKKTTATKAGKTTAAKAPATKTAAKKTTATKTAAKKTAAAKAPAKKTTAKKAAGSRRSA